MKNLFKNLMLVAVAAMAFTACTETNEEVNAVNEKVTLTFVAGFGEDTRVSLDNSDNDKVYKAAWEDGDTVTFAVFENADATTPKEISGAFRVSAPAETVEFTVTFTNGLEAGNVIKAYVNYNVYESWGWFYTDKEYDQYPSNDGPSCVYASASVVYAEGVDYATLSFEHDYAYGLMTIENLPFATSYFQVVIDDNSFYVNTNENKGYTGEKLWFYCPEDLDVKEFQVVAYSNDYTQNSTFVRTFDGEGEFAFKKGRVSRFTVSSWKSKLAMPSVDVAVSGQTITLSWASVADVDGYRVTSSSYDDEVIDVLLPNTQTSYEFNAKRADSYYSFYVYAYANDDNESFVTSNGKYIWVQSKNTNPVMSLSTNSVTFDAAGESKQVIIDAAYVTSPVTVSEDCEWIEATLDGDVLTITASANSGEERSATVVVSAGGVEDQPITVTQRAFGAAEPDGSEENPYVFNGQAYTSGWEVRFIDASNGSKLHMDCNNTDMRAWINDHGANTWIKLSSLLYGSGASIYTYNGRDYINADFSGYSYMMLENNNGTYTCKFKMSVDFGNSYVYYVYTGKITGQQ